MSAANENSGSHHPMADALGRFLRERYPFETYRDTLASDTGWMPSLWRALGKDLGILGAAIPEHLGGLGGGAGDQLWIAAELGPALAAEPWLSTAVIGGGFLAATKSPLAPALLRAIIEGEAVLAFAYAEAQGRHNLSDLRTSLTADGDGYRLNGHKVVVRGAPWARHFIVTARSAGGQRDADGVSVMLVERDAAGVRMRSYPTIDGGRAADIWFDNVRIAPEALLTEAGAALPLVERVVDEATIALCAEAVGIMRRLLRDTVEFASQRRQFGSAIAGFQVIQHRMADMLMQCEQADAITTLTALALDPPHAQCARAVSSAKVTTAKACRLVGQAAIQIHGGMGMTDELVVGHYFKRLTVIENLFGSVDFHLRRVAGIQTA